MSIFTPVLLADGKEELPIRSRPIVVMQLAEFFKEEGSVLIGPHLMTPQEIDEFVELIVADAEAFRRLAKHELEVAQTRASRG